MQVIKRKNFGELTFERTWTNGNTHIGKLSDGGYASLGGMPITSVKELEDCIPRGKFLEEALEWWENRDKIKPRETKKRLLINEDGSYEFEDGSQITGVGDLISNIPKGPALDAAIMWFADHARVKTAVKAKKVEPLFTCEVCGKICKSKVALNGHLRVHSTKTRTAPVTVTDAPPVEAPAEDDAA